MKKIDARIVRVGSIIWIVYQKEAPRRADKIESAAIDKFNRDHRAILDKGIYLPPSGYEVMFVSLAHTKAMLDRAARTIGEVSGS